MMNTKQTLEFLRQDGWDARAAGEPCVAPTSEWEAAWEKGWRACNDLGGEHYRGYAIVGQGDNWPYLIYNNSGNLSEIVDGSLAQARAKIDRWLDGNW